MVLLSIWEEGGIYGAAIQTPPRALILSQMSPEAHALLAQYLTESPLTFPGILGPEPSSGEFAALWVQHTKRPYKRAVKQMIYELREVIPPRSIPGTLHLASQADVEIVAKWFQDFHSEALPFDEPRTWEKALEDATRRIGRSEIFLRKIKDTYVTIAGISSPTPNGIRINGVYTPKGYRGNGYASAHVAEVSQQQLNLGRKFCFLYTDADYPTSIKSISISAINLSVILLFTWKKNN